MYKTLVLFLPWHKPSLKAKLIGSWEVKAKGTEFKLIVGYTKRLKQFWF